MKNYYSKHTADDTAKKVKFQHDFSVDLREITKNLFPHTGNNSDAMFQVAFDILDEEIQTAGDKVEEFDEMAELISEVMTEKEMKKFSQNHFNDYYFLELAQLSREGRRGRELAMGRVVLDGLNKFQKWDEFNEATS